MGFPSPATDYTEDQLSLDEHLIEHREATFFVKASGSSMRPFGIHDGDLMVVDRAVDPVDQSVVVAVIDGEFTVKQLCHVPDGIVLRTGDPTEAEIRVTSEQDVTIWGVVRYSIHKV